jgi:hypothetical protein
VSNRERATKANAASEPSVRSTQTPLAAQSAFGPQVQRQALDGSDVAEHPRTGGLIVDDESGALAAGQMRKSEFLELLRRDACAAADEAMAETGRSTAGCPFVDRVISNYRERDARHVERALLKYAPAARAAATARDYVPIVSAKIASGASIWARTGQLPADVPPEMVSAAISGGSALELVSSALGGVFSMVGGLFAKKDGAESAEQVDHAALADRLGPGRPFESEPRARMERAFGHDFGGVRIHADARAADLSHDLHARAFTLGSHVAFGRGEYRPGAPTGDALLAHELAHVLQQNAAQAPAAITGQSQLARARSPLEADADQAASQVVESLWVPGSQDARPVPKTRSGGGLRLQRCDTSADVVQKPVENKPPATVKTEKQETAKVETPAQPPVAEPEAHVDWVDALPIAGATTPGQRKLGVGAAQGPLSEYKWNKGTAEFSYRKDVGEIGATPKDQKAADKAAAQVQKARERVAQTSSRTFASVDERTHAGPMKGYERSSRKKVTDQIAAEGTEAEKAADKSYAAFLAGAKTSSDLQAFSGFEGDPSSVQGSDKANLTWGPGIAASGGGFQKLLKRVIDESPEAKRAFHEVGIGLIEHEESERGKHAMMVVDTEKKWRLIAADAELYIRANRTLLAVFVNVAQGYVDGLDKPANDNVRRVFLKAIAAGIPKSTSRWTHEDARLLAMRAVHSGQFKESDFDPTWTKAQVDAKIRDKLPGGLVDQMNRSVTK